MQLWLKNYETEMSRNCNYENIGSHRMSEDFYNHFKNEIKN